MAQITSDLLRSKFGFNDPNVIEGILRDPSQVQRYAREAGLDPEWNTQQTLERQKAESVALDTKQRGEEEAFMSALTGRIAGQEPLGAAAERIGGELQLPALRQSAFDLTQTLAQKAGYFRDIAPEQQTKAKQFGISAPNLSARIRAKEIEYQPTVETAQRGAQEGVARQQFAEGELSTRLGYLMAEQAKDLQPFYQAQLPLLTDRFAREQTNYTQDKQNELTLILNRINQGFQASQAELDRANQLATSEQDFNRTLEQISFQTNEDIRKSRALKPSEKPSNPLNTYVLDSPAMSSQDGTRSGNWISYGGQWYPVIQELK